MKGWIGVDLDGTLAHYEGWNNGAIGAPIPAMLLRVKKWMKEGREVRIFTARISDRRYAERVVVEIQAWLRVHGLPTLKVTNCKDLAMVELWDDRCVQVEKNTGRRMDGQSD
jgi:hypothetical protein